MNSKRILIIGPTYPYKGGISHHTSLLYRALKKRYDTSLISYCFQYPKILLKREQKDYQNDAMKVADTKYWIHTLNPFNWLNVARKIRKLAPDLILIQWWHPYFALCYWSILHALRVDIPKVFICHNVLPHERFPMDSAFTKLTLNCGNGYIVHSKKDLAELQQVIKNPRYVLSVLPTFDLFSAESWSREVTRKTLNIMPDKPVLLFFGFVKAYKGLKYLLASIPIVLEALSDVILLVAGEFDEDRLEYERLIKQYNIADHVVLIDKYIPDQEVGKYFSACDLVILPYESATQSGIPQIAYEFDKPVIATDVGGLPEVVVDGKTGYIVPPRNAKELSAAIIRFFHEHRQDEFRRGILKEKTKYSWEHFVDKISLFLEE